jgi:hypothetical protein
MPESLSGCSFFVQGLCTTSSWDGAPQSCFELHNLRGLSCVCCREYEAGRAPYESLWPFNSMFSIYLTLGTYDAIVRAFDFLRILKDRLAVTIVHGGRNHPKPDQPCPDVRILPLLEVLERFHTSQIFLSPLCKLSHTLRSFVISKGRNVNLEQEHMSSPVLLVNIVFQVVSNLWRNTDISVLLSFLIQNSCESRQYTCLPCHLFSNTPYAS